MDPMNPKRPLSEISHLFLSNVRDLPKPGAPRPVRVPPGGGRIQQDARIQRDKSIDLTPEEFAEVFGKLDLDEDRPTKKPTVTAVLAAHLAGSQSDRAKAYARHYAVSTGGRVGMIEVDAHEFRLTCFQPGVESHAACDDGEGEPFDPRRMAEAISEMNVDVDHWLLLVLNPRLPESRNLLRSVNHWVMLSTCDHDGVVCCYRTLKGLADLHSPRLSLALLDARTHAEATVIHRKLASVCRQFLGLPLTRDAVVEPADSVTEHLVLNCRPLHDKAQLASGSQWQVVSEFLAGANTDGPPDVMSEDEALAAATAPNFKPAPEPEAIEEKMPRDKAAGIRPSNDLPRLDPFAMREPMAPMMPALSVAKAQAAEDASDVVDLPSADASPTTILSAVVRHGAGALVECPIRPPMAPESALAVDRERGIVLLSVARSGLTDLRLIAQAYQWLIQNRQLIAMAMPQFAIDAHRLPSLRLLVDHRDMTADLLQPMLEAGHVTVQAYRKLRWGAKAGLLLEAA